MTKTALGADPASNTSAGAAGTSRAAGPDAPRLFFFCIGCQKTGSTLLARMLDQHPKIACMWESYAFAPYSHNSIFLEGSKSAVSHGFAPADVKRWGDAWRKQLSPPFLTRIWRKLSGKTNESYQVNPFPVNAFRSVFTEALNDFGRRCGAEVVGDKTPFYLERIDILLEAFPNAKYIYGVRDPRAVWNSAQRFKGRQKGDEILAELLEKDDMVLPYVSRPNFHTVRYEDLVLEPSLACRRLYAFLGCDYSDEYLVYRPETDPYPTRWDWIAEAKDQLNPRHATKWRDQMTAEEIKRVTETSKVMLERHHYEP